MNNYTYFRLVSMPTRQFLRRMADPEYLVKVVEGAPRRVKLSDLPDALGVAPEDSRRDWQECEMLATRLFLQGDEDNWVEYPTGRVVGDAD